MPFNKFEISMKNVHISDNRQGLVKSSTFSISWRDWLIETLTSLVKETMDVRVSKPLDYKCFFEALYLFLGFTLI